MSWTDEYAEPLNPSTDIELLEGFANSVSTERRKYNKFGNLDFDYF
jgi:hypothetical protein